LIKFEEKFKVKQKTDDTDLYLSLPLKTLKVQETDGKLYQSHFKALDDNFENEL
jgi:hypothetical protein